MALRINLLFSATPEQLFDAWTKRDLVEKWLFTNETTNSIRADIDPRPGGRLFIQADDQGTTIEHFGTYIDVIKPGRLTLTLEIPAHFKGQSRVAVEFKATEVGTEMYFIQVGVDPEIVASNWNVMFQNLTKLLLSD